MQMKDNRILFFNFLKRLYRSSPRKHLHIITDGISLVQHKDAMDWIQRRKRLAVYFTPSHASWLSQIEILIQYLHARCDHRWAVEIKETDD